MSVADLLYPQNSVSLVPGGTRDISERLFSPEPDPQNLARKHALELEFGPHESHRANLGGNVDVMVGLYGSWVYGHVPNYTPNAGRCRVLRHA
jgi:hypothetical protein